MSQTEFCDAFGISIHTLRNWEQMQEGQAHRKPSGPTTMYLLAIEKHPDLMRRIVWPLTRNK